MLLEKIDTICSQNIAPYKQGLQVRLMDAITAIPEKRLRLDPQGYFIIHVRRGNENPLYVEHYKNNGVLCHVIEGKDPATLCATLINMELISRLDHAAYIGRELVKAETALLTNSKFVQDKAQGDLCCC